MDNWKLSFDTIYKNLINSDILNKCDNIYYCVCGNYQEAIEHIGQEHTILLKNNINDFEFPTINFLLNDCKETPQNVLYIHTKGASTPFTQPIIDWIELMCYFNISQYKSCLELLEKYDAIGVDYHSIPFKHFSGNFWWATSHHINKLNLIENEDRHAAERWVCSVDGKYGSLHNTNISVYERHLHEYNSTKYR